MNIYIIGGGDIGQRHIQSTLNFNSEHTINIVEINKENLDKCKKIAFGRKNYNFYSSLPENKQIDLLFIATTSSNRFDIFTNIVKKNVVTNIILEKVVFQIPSQYRACKKTLKLMKINCWINNWPRTAEYFKEIKKKLLPEEPISMKVYGRSWGIACNASHYIDLFVFFADIEQVNSMHFEIIKKFDSKRLGYKEFMGVMRVDQLDSSSLEMIDSEKHGGSIIVEVLQGRNTFKISEKNYKVFLESNVQGFEESFFKEPLQSETSHININKILKEGDCDLPKFILSYDWHSKMVSSFNSSLGIDPVNGKCPIT
tara:strand:+ start:48 stop:986 length:939 start_codon:yes stop_codon:yes gene_type:complete